ncbi:MAG: chemotaxis-specific protein-glutamate methyltransferase CheB [Gemmatimonadetes bacterium]|nr:chemotaxis-specific protein-glutamate methyltransferase CheB [Gemmatimonadota bacterium]
MIRVLVADDSATVRELLVAALEADPDVEVVGRARDGEEAVDLAVRLRPDVITMDVHMPGMNGLEATREIMVRAPTPIVIVSSAADPADVSLSLDATRAGALMVMPALGEPLAAGFNERRAELVGMVKAMAEVRVVRRHPRRPAGPPRSPTRAARGRTELVAIAASTGGPAALHCILRMLPRDFAAPILVVQHIAPNFIEGLCAWLASACDLRVKLARQGEALTPGTVYLAPDRRHLGTSADGKIVLSDGEPLSGFRPSASHLFGSVARSHGSAAGAVILTGMGRDGVDGLHAVRAAGGRILAQDQATSVVYAMPREAVDAGLADAVLPLAEIAPRLVQWVQGGTR